ncbi:hypothetical protein PCK2_000780 [Pneumocystis canis]|nr:hypothetical protein PCK2_000780 [Pneumocystis canis]
MSESDTFPSDMSLLSLNIKDFKRSKSSSPRKPLGLKENINEHNFFNISQRFNKPNTTSIEGLDIKDTFVKKTYSEPENSPKKPWTPKRIILQQENESLKKYINELKESIEKNEKIMDENDDDRNDNTVKKLRDLVDFVQLELKAKNSEI